MKENDTVKCQHCGEFTEGRFVFECPTCGREGCPECMPAGKDCECPECEEGGEGSVASA